MSDRQKRLEVVLTALHSTQQSSTEHSWRVGGGEHIVRQRGTTGDYTVNMSYSERLDWM